MYGGIEFVIIKLMKKSKVTTEDLARMVQRGFETVDKKLDSLTEDMRLVKDRLDAIEIELIDIKKKLENVIDRYEFENLKERVKNLENRLAVALNKKK